MPDADGSDATATAGSEAGEQPKPALRFSALGAPAARLEAALRARWDGMAPNARGAFLVSLGSLTLVVMATVVKALGHRLPSFEMLFFRNVIGFLCVLPMFVHDPWEPFRTRHQLGHFTRGAMSAIGNGCFFWTITHMLLADAMALQFSRPLFMLPLAIMFLGETARGNRIGVTIVGFIGILIYARPFTAGFDPGVFVGAFGALAGGLVLLCIKQLSKTEPTRVIMFYYALWNVVLALPTAAWDWVTPVPSEFLALILIGVLGISGQSLITSGFTIGNASALVPLDYVRVIYSAIFAWLLFGEIPDIYSWIGMAVIISASLYLVQTDTKKAGKG